MRYSQMIVYMILICGGIRQSPAQTVIPDIDPSEIKGERPYEMVWANRTEPVKPVLSFDSLDGWHMEAKDGAEGILRLSREQDIWGRPLAKLSYKGQGSSRIMPKVLIYPSKPVELPEGADIADLWVYGNRWEFANPPDTPPVFITLYIKDSTGTIFPVLIDTIRWEEWYLCHKKLPAGMKYPAYIESIEVSGGWQKEWRHIYIDSIYAYKEILNPLEFEPRPKRNLRLFDKQSPGANIGPDALSFPTRDETILPVNYTAEYKNSINFDNDFYEFAYSGTDCKIIYGFDPAKGLDGIAITVDGNPMGKAMCGSGMISDGKEPSSWLLHKTTDNDGYVNIVYDDGTELNLRIMQKSFVIDVINRSRKVGEFNFGSFTELTNPKTIWVPYMTYGSTHPAVLRSLAGKKWVFASLHPDWYRSNGSELYGNDTVFGDIAYINGGVRYLNKTDGAKNPVFERLFLTVSPNFDEVLPVIPNPVGLHAAEAIDKLWQETWGPDNHENVMKWSKRLRNYGIRNLIQCNHEIGWRDDGESFTLRTRSAPKKGGDDSLREYVKHQRSLGWISGLYTNYTDFAPVNEYWNPDWVQRQPSGEWRNGWPRCWLLKPLRAVEMDARLAPMIKEKFGTNSSYTDVHTAVPPWIYNDYDARVPGAGTFAQTFFAYGELLRNDSKVYDGPIFSEGTYHWLYAGLADGNYAHTYDGRQIANEPLLPSFDLYQIHTKECDIGVSWTANFCEALPNWSAPENIDNAIDRMILHTLAYGHIGWLVESAHGINRTCRSYYMLQQVQKRYGLKAPLSIKYWNGQKFENTSEAIISDIVRMRRQMYVEYPGGLKLWLNDHPTEDWTIKTNNQTFIIPSAGWVCRANDGFISYSAIIGGSKADYCRSDEYIYQDARGKWFSTDEAASNGGLAIMPKSKNELEIIHISGDGDFIIKRPFSMIGIAVSCEAYDQDGIWLANPLIKDSGEQTYITPVDGGVRYILRFSGKPGWSISADRYEVPAGERVELKTDASGVSWMADGQKISDGKLTIPAGLLPGQMIKVTGIRGNEERYLFIRVCPHVVWRIKNANFANGTEVNLLPYWNICYLPIDKFSLDITTGNGWKIAPDHVDIYPPRLPSVINLAISAEDALSSEGKLNIALSGLITTFKTDFILRSKSRDNLIADLRKLKMIWGVGPRNADEKPDNGSSMAVCYPDQSMSVGGISKSGIYMHPPYMGMVGYTWAMFTDIDLPDEPCEFSAAVGLRDGGITSDGVIFRVELTDANGKTHKIADTLGIRGGWRSIKADLSRFSGQRVGIKLISDPGVNDDTTSDWACWGEPSVRYSNSGVTISISESVD